MEHVRDYVESLRAKPEHVRRRIAVGSSIGVTALVAVGWFAALTSSGALAISPTPDPTSAALVKSATDTKEDFSGLLGAASAYQGAKDGGVMVVDGQSSSTMKAESNDSPTVIPF